MVTKKYPLTSAGVDGKISDLYGQSDTQIESEAIAVESDLYSWMSSNFELRPEQVSYMYALGSEFAVQNGRVLAYCFRHRLGVTLTKGDLALRSSKFIRREENVEVTSQPDQEDQISGGVDYFIS
ncbi:hypothetical protein [Sphingobacterium thalpophilum]|uniref:hypothetical protein n=1 Tax=Sphingobacterium thalpophilum TaxID=259 RepID=UPI002D774D2E|nr:hypothetical protein [Sphingobacterium thalpophilum]